MFDPDYRLFLAVAEAGNLSAAGRTLSISPAMMSKRLSRLEERLGVRLVHRSTRRLSLTPQGQNLHSDLVGIMAALTDAELRAKGTRGFPAGPLRVTAPTSFGRIHLAPYVGRFLDLYPDVELSLDLSDDFTDLMATPVDLAIRITTALPSNVNGHRLASSERVLCSAPAYLKSRGEPRDIASLAGHRLLAADGQLPWSLNGPEGVVTISGRSHVRTNSSELVRELAIAGVGVALRSLWDVNEHLANGDLVRVLPEYEGSADSAIYAVHLPMPVLPPAIAAFIAFLQKLYEPTPPWQHTHDEHHTTQAKAST